MSIKKMICYVLGHSYTLKPKPDILSNKRVCKLCNKKQIRAKYPVFGIDCIWIDD